MQALLNEMIAQLSPQTIFSIIGGMLGALILSKKERDGYLLSIVFILFGISCAMIASDYITREFSNHLLAAHFAIGMPSGGIGGSMMMALRAISPSLANKLVGMADGFVDGLTESRVAKAIKLLLGKDTTD